MFDLERFKRAQGAAEAGFADAVRELRAGRKTSHWIWYVFPQLAGLGRSPAAVHYGLAGYQEAAAYLRDPLLAERLVAAAAAVRAHVEARGGHAAPLAEIMGSDIDANKLVSCMTLFARVAPALYAEDRRPELAALIEHADAILAAGRAQGYPRCSFTEERLASG
jgi:uncharacterized protein (DUF1810 family)